MSENSTTFSSELIEFINEWREKPGNLIMVLHRVQSEFGYVSQESADEVSKMLGIPFAKVWGVFNILSFL